MRNWMEVIMKRGRKQRRQITALLLAAILLFASQPIPAAAKTAIPLEEFEETIGTYSINDEIVSYEEYLEANGTNRPEEVYVIEGSDYVRFEDETGSATPEIYTDYKGMEGKSIYTKESGLVEYEVTIQKAGLYRLSVLYFPVEGKNTAIQRSFFIDGKMPYQELALIEFARVWQNDVNDFTFNSNGIEQKLWEKDNQGNDLKPGMIETPQWIEGGLYDGSGYVTEELSFYLEEGVHTITIISIKEPMLLRKLTLQNGEEIRPYSEVKASLDTAGKADTHGKQIRIEAENVARTSSQMLYPVQDQSSPAVYPSSAKELKNNTVGGNSWRLVGQWMEWEFEVEEDGYYNMAFYAKQNFMKGIYVSRKIMIDGKVPFDEFEDYGFTYEQNWRLDTMEDSEGKPYLIYLDKGTHTLRMQVVLGEFSGIISDVQDAVSKLNAIYRKVIRITGVAPDAYRDYQIETSLPELEGELTEVKEILEGALADLRAAAGAGSDKESVLVTMIDQLKELIKDQERFTKVLGSFKINIRACGNWITQVIVQPLQLDTIYIYSPDVKIDVASDGFFSRMFYELKKLFYSFVIDYNQIGNVAKEKQGTVLTLWIGSGRDQANVIKSLIDETFTNETGISVNVMLVDMSTLLQATLAGQGPDVAIQVGNDLPMNYGLRNAVADLSQFEDLPEIKKRFNASAMTAFEYEGRTYALPETQTFPMLFYRKDILKDLNLAVPKTWDEVKVALTVLSKNQMDFGMLPGEQIFAMFLYQNGGEYYAEGALKSALDSDEAVNAFKEYCEYYTDYKVDQQTNAEERFRTGEAPMIIADYTVYNNLQVSAPDIKGLWGFTPVPGVLKEDGTIDNTVASTGLGCVIMEKSKDKDASWEFLKWWTSAETQTLYGREMESLMGAAARVATANMEAFSNLPWPVSDFDALSEQFKHVRGIPQVPGGYFSYRNVNNAFYRVTTKTDVATPREELMDNVLYINEEINFKRAEFGMPLAEE